ncbi:tyrosine-type recombinase/integrase [Thiomicrorhabdus xiamenensis]|uniref:Tyrosine-type recombinase/integrase n=1 Tax=Thiomicrorhabdus xiamenensis TaxID=2739063 RepID=A0A7D4SJ89_9GAMM|nr:tyrosine-type recombinase/integrase [Thiomicrorhabdus xiamenensis]QKI89639.1 tyrosine-type recombinase/integrase [Thiomicrorhabdus xiamenensis]
MLNNTQIKNLKPREKLYRETDSHGLVLEVKPSGVKAWRYRCRINGKATMLSLGNFPQVSLAEARRARDDLKALIKSGIDPRQQVQDELTSELEFKTFYDMYLEWYRHNVESWSEGYAKDLDERCQNHLLPFLKDRNIAEISAMDMLDVFKRIETKGTLNMLKKVRGYASRVFRYSVGMGICSFDPTRDLPQDVFKKETVKSFAHITSKEELAVVLSKIESYNGGFSVSSALKIAPHVFLRPSELVSIKWENVDFDGKIVRIESHKMKMKREHLVPMSNFVEGILREALEVKTDSQFVFPSPRSKTRPITPDSLRVALRTVDIGPDVLTTHGFRHTASTMLNEMGWPADAIEKQLSHEEKNKIRGIYNKAEYLDVRKKMMEEWSIYLRGCFNKSGL